MLTASNKNHHHCIDVVSMGGSSPQNGGTAAYGHNTKKSFGGIPNSRIVLFFQIFLKRAAKPSLLNRNLLRNPVEPDLALHQSLPDLLRNLLRNLLNLWLGFAPRLPGTFFGTFSRTLLNLTSPCTKASRNLLRNLLRNPVEPDLGCTKASQTFTGTFGTFSGTLLNLTRRLHQCTPELFWAEDPISLRCWGKKVYPKFYKPSPYMELAYAAPCYKLGMFNLPNRATEMIPPGSSSKLCCPGTSAIFAREQPMQYLNITRSAVPPGEKPLAPFLNAGGPWPVTSNKNLVGPSSGKWGFDMC